MIQKKSSNLIDRISVSFDQDDIEILNKLLSSKKYDSYAAAIRAAVRIAFGKREVSA